VGQSRALLELYPLLDGTVRLTVVLLLLDSGDVAGARALFDEVDLDGPEFSGGDLVSLFQLSAVAEATAVFGEPAVAAKVLGLMAPYQGRFVTLGYTGVFGAVDTYLGILSSVLDAHDEAVAHLERGVEFCAAAQCPVVAAEARAWLAWALGRRGREGDRATADDVRAEVAAASAALGMPGLAARIERLGSVPGSERGDMSVHPTALDRGRARLTARARNLVEKLSREHSDDDVVRRFASPLAQRALLSAMAKSFQPARAFGFEGPIVFEVVVPVDGEDPLPSDWWTIEVRGRRASARPGRADDAPATIRTDLPTLVRLLSGELHPLQAVTERRVHVDGDAVLAGRIPEMFGGLDLHDG
jgi:hypothetical protein